MDCFAKKGLSTLDSIVGLSNFPKDVTYINFEDTCGFLSNSVCKFFIP